MASSPTPETSSTSRASRSSLSRSTGPRRSSCTRKRMAHASVSDWQHAQDMATSAAEGIARRAGDGGDRAHGRRRDRPLKHISLGWAWDEKSSKNCPRTNFHAALGEIEFLITVRPKWKSFEDITVNARAPHISFKNIYSFSNDIFEHGSRPKLVRISLLRSVE